MLTCVLSHRAELFRVQNHIMTIFYNFTLKRSNLVLDCMIHLSLDWFINLKVCTLRKSYNMFKKNYNLFYKIKKICLRRYILRWLPTENNFRPPSNRFNQPHTFLQRVGIGCVRSVIIC